MCNRDGKEARIARGTGLVESRIAAVADRGAASVSLFVGTLASPRHALARLGTVRCELAAALTLPTRTQWTGWDSKPAARTRKSDHTITASELGQTRR